MFKCKAAHAVAALLCAAADPASAALITQTGSVYDNAPISIDQFSVPYKLDSVTYSVTYSLSALFRNNLEYTSLSISYLAYLNSQDFGYSVFQQTTSIPQNGYVLMSGSGNATGEITSGLERFTGYGTFQSPTASSFEYAPAGAVSLLRLSTSATYSISYNFDDTVAAIPEPGTWALVLLGFGMIGYAIRRRKLAFA